MDIVKKAESTWRGPLRSGQGMINTESGSLKEEFYGHNTRFGDEKGASPEELIGAAHSACYSMALSKALEDAGFDPDIIKTEATVHLSKGGDGFEITTLELKVTGKVPTIKQERFRELAKEANKACPLSKAFKSEIQITTELI